MLFSSLAFLFCFLPTLIIAYYIIPQKHIMARRFILLVFSILFYAAGEPVYVFVIMLCVTITWRLTASFNKKAAYIIAILINFLPFLILKYFDFIAVNFASIFRINYNPIGILPLGISFYTFQILSYLIDLYHGRIQRQNNPALLALYVFLFPQLIAGPIVRYSDVERDLQGNCCGDDVENVKSGLERFVVGLGKKVLIANQVGYIADTALNKPWEQLSTGLMWAGAIAFTMQIYYDFSGYSDMAIGLGKMFGFSFPENFDSPYCSLSVTEFWRRWHKTLGAFFRDYIYIPLGGNRVSKQRWIINILIVWMLTGFWHGASWNFAIWGLYYGILLLIEKTIQSSVQINHRIKMPDRMSKVIRYVVVFVIVTFGWVIFYYDKLDIVEIMKRGCVMFGIIRHTSNDSLSVRSIYPQVVSALPWLCIAFFMSSPIGALVKNQVIKIRGKALWHEIGKDVVLISVFVLCIVFLIGGSYNPFIYFRF